MGRILLILFIFCALVGQAQNNQRFDNIIVRDTLSVTGKTTLRSNLSLTLPTAGRVMILDAAGNVTNSPVTPTELSQLSGLDASPSLEVRLDAKQPLHATLTRVSVDGAISSIFTNGTTVGAVTNLDIVYGTNMTIRLTNVNGSAKLYISSIPGGSGGAQTPLAQDVNAASFSITNLKSLQLNGSLNRSITNLSGQSPKLDFTGPGVLFWTPTNETILDIAPINSTNSVYALLSVTQGATVLNQTISNALSFRNEPLVMLPDGENLFLVWWDSAAQTNKIMSYQRLTNTYTGTGSDVRSNGPTINNANLIGTPTIAGYPTYTQLNGSNYATRAEMSGSNYVNFLILAGSNYVNRSELAGSNYLRNALLSVKTNGVMASDSATTNINIIYGTNQVVQTTNINGTLHVHISSVPDGVGSGEGGSETNWTRNFTDGILSPTIATDHVNLPRQLNVSNIVVTNMSVQAGLDPKNGNNFDTAFIQNTTDGYGTWSRITPALSVRRMSWWLPATTTPSTCGFGENWGSSASISMVEATALLPQATVINTPAAVGASNAVSGAGGSPGFKSWWPGRSKPIRFTCGFWIGVTNETRAWVGLSSATATQLGAGGLQPNFDLAIARYDDSGSNIVFLTSNSGSAWTETITPIPMTDATPKEIQVDEADDGSAWYLKVGGVNVATNTTNLPVGTGMSSMIFVMTKNTTAKTNYLFYAQTTGDY